jgi:hypothetical protein
MQQLGQQMLLKQLLGVLLLLLGVRLRLELRWVGVAAEHKQQHRAEEVCHKQQCC